MTTSSVEADTSTASIVTWDLVRGILDWRLWAFLGLQDIRQRYRRSALGPLWLALGLGATILGIGILYTQILKTTSGSYIPFLAIGLLVWNYMASTVAESTVLFQGVGHVISSVRVPYTSFVLRAIVRNLIVAAHSAIVVVIAFAWMRFPVDTTAILALPGLLLVSLNLYWIGLLIGIISARFRDMAQIFNYAVAIGFFLTPVIWAPTAIRPGSPYLYLNPFAQMLELVRGPIYDHRIPIYAFTYCSALFLVGISVTMLVFVKSRRFVVHWI